MNAHSPSYENHSTPPLILRSGIVQSPFPHTVIINNYITNQYNAPCTPERRPTPVVSNAPERQRRPVVNEHQIMPVPGPFYEFIAMNTNLQFGEDSDSDSEIDAPYVTMTRGNLRRDENDSDMEIDDEEEDEDTEDAETVVDPYEPMDIDNDDDDNTVIAY